jgi:hypothetical protein
MLKLSRAILAAALLAALGGLAGLAGAARGQAGGTAPGATTPQGPVNPCTDPNQQPRLRCPDLILYRPYDLHYERVGRQLRLHAANSIVNKGTGPAQLHGRRDGPRSMAANQVIRAVDGSVFEFPTGARLAYKFVDRSRGSFWKFRNAARFELWSRNPDGSLNRRVRIGPKLIYCLRDLNKRFSSPYSPRTRRFPACNQNPNLRSDTLGTSVGWSDDYPARYPEQWIDVAGLRGRYAFFQVVDPRNGLWESNEANNRSPIVYLNLPPRASGSSPTDSYGY